MNVVFTPTAWQQYTDWQKEDKKIVKRINELIKSIDRDGLLEGIGIFGTDEDTMVCRIIVCADTGIF